MQYVPRAAGAEHDAQGIHALPILHTGLMALQRVRLAWREPQHEARQLLVSNTPGPAGVLRVFMHAEGSERKAFVPTEYP
jgi:hypothetical protein